jgi:hypothetical protein
MTLPIAFLDISLYQVPGASGADMTIPPGSVPPDFTVARARGVAGIIARACNDIRPDPSYRLFIPAARGAGLDTGAYTYVRPPRGSALLHADRLLAEVDAAGGTTLPPMVDMENFDGQNDWAGDRYVDWILELVDRLHAKDGRVPLGYGGKWFLDPMTQPRQAELVDAFQSIIVPAYPHQPAAWPQQQWPLPPVDVAAWEDWARTTQGGDPGLPAGPTLPTGVDELDAWQFSSMGDTAAYGWTTSHHLDLNVATEAAWNAWRTEPEVPPVAETMYPVGYGRQLVTMAAMRRIYEPKMEPEFARRLFNWLDSRGGQIGCGGGWRRPRPRAGYPIPGGGDPTPTPPTTGGTFTMELQKNELTPAKREQLYGNGDVFLIQQIAQGHYRQLGNPAYDCGSPDGDYGDRTQKAVRQIQADGGLKQDGCCGQQTWAYILNKTGA